ncbi:hypothetical protein Ccrd_012380, partial [Cynara cardunculus var. scolymus]
MFVFKPKCLLSNSSFNYEKRKFITPIIIIKGKV